MLTEIQAREIAVKIVNAAKSTSRVDTGALKRSISYTYVKGEIIFRQLYYGVYGTNSSLEKYAKKYVPRGQPWKVILTNWGGETVEVKRSASGGIFRKITSAWSSTKAKQTTENIRAAISRVLSNRKKEEKINGKT